MGKVVVGLVDSMPPGSRTQIEVDRRAIVIFNVDGEFYALRDTCPHQGARLSQGTVVGSITSPGPGRYEYDATRKLVRCPWHGWEYELATGQSWFDPAHNRVRRYPVSVESGHVLSAREQDFEASGRSPGPYLAETFRISVQDDYVVVEI